MRINNEKHDIDYKSTRNFFARRAEKYHADNPYSVTMYQDNNAELVQQRNLHETEKLSARLNLDADSHVLDLACGIGRWADAIADSVGSYTGIDFSEDLIRIAIERNDKANVTYVSGPLTVMDSILDDSQRYNRVLMIGILMYLNDADVTRVTEIMEKHLDANTVICIREPIALVERLTLKDFYSDELKDNYNAIYRTREELIELITPSLLNRGFSIAEEGFLFDDDALNNRKETAQYFYILKR